MQKRDEFSRQDGTLSRRSFLKAGGATLAAGALFYPPGVPPWPGRKKELAQVQRHRVLGRTGFSVSDIGIGCGYLAEANVVRYAYDRGINYFDAAETFSGGDSERKIGEAMAHMERAKIFITTKLQVEAEDTEETIRERFAGCLERMQTDYADALFMHSVANAALIDNAGFHAAVAGLKAEGRLRHAGLSNHGPRDEGEDSMEQVLLAAVEDGRFDLMLLTYNFLNREEAERVLAACKERNIGTTAMKTMPGYLHVEPWDEENPFEGYTSYIERVAERGVSREQAIENIKGWIAEQETAQEGMQPFIEKHGIESQERLRELSIQWVLKNPDMHTVCVSMPDFESIDSLLPLSGTQLASADEAYLRDWELAFGSRYCRHGCHACLAACPKGVPVSTIMRYSHYFTRQRREKYAMGKYARLGDRNATLCADCEAPCTSACPHGVQIPANLIQAHTLLTLA